MNKPILLFIFILGFNGLALTQTVYNEDFESEDHGWTLGGVWDHFPAQEYTSEDYDLMNIFMLFNSTKIIGFNLLDARNMDDPRLNDTMVVISPTIDLSDFDKESDFAISLDVAFGEDVHYPYYFMEEHHVERAWVSYSLDGVSWIELGKFEDYNVYGGWNLDIYFTDYHYGIKDIGGSLIQFKITYVANHAHIGIGIDNIKLALEEDSTELEFLLDEIPRYIKPNSLDSLNLRIVNKGNQTINSLSLNFSDVFELVHLEGLDFDYYDTLDVKLLPVSSTVAAKKYDLYIEDAILNETSYSDSIPLAEIFVLNSNDSVPVIIQNSIGFSALSEGQIIEGQRMDSTYQDWITVNHFSGNDLEFDDYGYVTYYGLWMNTPRFKARGMVNQTLMPHFSQYKEAYEKIKSENWGSPVGLEIDYDFDRENNVLNFSVSCTAQTSITDSLHNIEVTLMEDHVVTGDRFDNKYAIEDIPVIDVEGTDWTELPFSIYDMEFDDVVRYMQGTHLLSFYTDHPDLEISFLDDMEAGETQVYEYSYPLKEGEKIEDFSIVAKIVDHGVHYCANVNCYSIGRVVSVKEEVVNITSSTSEPTTERSMLSIAPNPSSDFYNISLSNKKINGYSVTDHTGKIIVANPRYHNSHLSLDLSGSPSGVYLLRVFSDGEEYMEKLVKI